MFTGIGGFDLALKRKGHDIVGACEIDKYARQIYARHFPHVPIHQDATKINPKELPDFDILPAGFPCQAFSVAGKRLGFEDMRGTLFHEIARVAREKRPRYLLLENVPGLKFHDKGRTFETILTILDELGYDAEWQSINSKHFVPQNRERIFIIGHLRGEHTRQVFPLGDCGPGNPNPSKKQKEKGNWFKVKLLEQSTLTTSKEPVAER
jgi:DNA (cytosine-5)-methyltransferase 1